ncbi:hypothetical protein P4O66_019471 [Electrophorus voltai]|uniref:Uncharacterized protein n=1 Tax=Electrophorus voltai TaxID=2609070 RepID=A0AAD8ZTR9_9TELE|nr:hypothetical protein P4O66_019471 [Electrophorus voltai]
MKSKQARKAKGKWFSALCGAGMEEAVRQDLNVPPCGRGGGVTSTSGTDSAALTAVSDNITSALYDPMKLLRIVPSYLSYEGSSDESLTHLCSKYEESDAVETSSQVSLQFSQSSSSAKSGGSAGVYETKTSL